MTELEKIKYTKTFIDKLANGINPVDNTEIPSDDVVNNIRISRCLFYVSDILAEIIKNGGTAKKSNNDKLPFAISPEQIADIPVTEAPVGISSFVKLINEQIDVETYNKLKITTVTEWLVEIDLLFVETFYGKRRKMPTEKGKGMGISVNQYKNEYGEHQMVVYDKRMQRFILDNMDTLIEKNNRRKAEVSS